MKRIIPLLTAALTLAACSTGAGSAVPCDELPPIYPDYTGVTVPSGIAPLDFTLRGADALEVTLSACNGAAVLKSRGGKSTRFPSGRWAALLAKASGDSVSVEVSARFGDKWKAFKPFPIYVCEDAIDYGLTYRLIEPGYEIYSAMGIYERELSSFRQRALLENTQFDGCVNCHSFNHNDPGAMSLHIRGAHGATILTGGGGMKAYNTRTDSTLGFCVYPYWHPGGRYIAYSTNNTRQGFHVGQDKIIEVFDLDSDLQIYDTEKNELITVPALRQQGVWESFPAFSPDGRTLYYTAAVKVAIPGELPQSRYNLMKVSFDPGTGTPGSDVEILVDAASQGFSVSFPRPSYDGRYLMYTVCDYGTFPIWHHEADLWLMDLETGETRPLDEANSDDTDSFHNWSSNSRWFVFSSRRDDGQFTRLYIAHFASDGSVGKPFMLPQRDPENYYGDLFRSYNVPEFVTGPVPFDKVRARKIIDSPDRIQFGYR